MRRSSAGPSRSRRSQRARRAGASPKFMLRLFVTGGRPASVRAIRNIRAICEKRLKGRYTLEIIDMYQQRGRAQQDKIQAAPTLVKKLPAPLRRMIGDLSDEKQVLLALDLYEAP